MSYGYGDRPFGSGGAAIALLYPADTMQFFEDIMCFNIFVYRI